MSKIEQLIKNVLKDADDCEEHAAYNGHHDDGGARILRMQVEYYKHGMKNTVPPGWKEYELKLDPEYEMYERLKKKFGK